MYYKGWSGYNLVSLAQLQVMLIRLLITLFLACPTAPGFLRLVEAMSLGLELLNQSS